MNTRTTTPVKTVVEVAKNWVRDVLSDENVSNIGLEEVEFDEENLAWKITIGFSRPWNSPRTNALSAFTDAGQKRAYRVITVSDRSRKVLSMKKRENDDT
jgi:hypothetical protein